MYTKNPVTGKNETLVNTSMLKGAVDGVLTKIADKADQGALDGLSVYTEHVADSVAGKADKADVAAVSAYAEGMLPKSVYGTMVDAYVGLACKVADPDVLEGAAKMAYAADPVKYATSNPSDNGCAEVTSSSDTIYKAITAAGSTVELPPFLRLKRWSYEGAASVDVTYWKTELPNLTKGSNMFRSTALTQCTTEFPNLTNASWMFYQTGLTSWDVELLNLTNGTGMFNGTVLASFTSELPNLVNGSSMFYNTSIEEWTTELPNLTDGSWMFGNGSQYDPDTPGAFKRFRGSLPALTSAEGMFMNCPLDLESIRCIAETINDVNDPSVSGDKKIDICLATGVIDEPPFAGYVNTIKEKGWRLVVNGESA